MTDTKKTFTLGLVLQLILVIVIVPLLPMLVAGIWNWWEAWVYAVASVLGFVLSRLLVARRHPDLLKERARSMQLPDTESWDRVLAPLLALGGILIVLVAGLDRRFEWTTPFAYAIRIASIIPLILGYVLGTWAMWENRFFSGVVRIQTDRGHHVVTTGPYRLVRHPGYAGALLAYLVTPVLLDSLWAFIPALLLLGVIVLRTMLEERTLRDALPGYRQYMKNTRFRLVPGVW